MKEALDDETRKALVEYRMAKASETLEEARYNFDGKHYNLAINRLYYACFYAASALLINNKVEASTHAGVKSQFHLLFIKTGIIPIDKGATLSVLFGLRQSGDYDDFFTADEQLVEMYMPQAVDFVSMISEIINK